MNDRTYYVETSLVKIDPKIDLLILSQNSILKQTKDGFFRKWINFISTAQVISFYSIDLKFAIFE